jgi:peptidoglycan/xylan/chitin deacetylase (PgdA/CDA1 family)
MAAIGSCKWPLSSEFRWQPAESEKFEGSCGGITHSSNGPETRGGRTFCKILLNFAYAIPVFFPGIIFAESFSLTRQIGCLRSQYRGGGRRRPAPTRVVHLWHETLSLDGTMLEDLAKRAARKALRTAAALPGGISLARWLQRGSVAIVMYHGVVEQPLEVFNWCQLQRDKFDKQIEFLADEYQICPLREIIDRLNRGLSLPERAVCITFDDGFRNNLRTAYPILLKHKAPATVFLVTSLIGTPVPPWSEQLYFALVRTGLAGIQFEDAEVPLKTHQERSAAYPKICSRLKRLPVEKKDALLEQLLDKLGRFSSEDDDALGMLSWEEVEKVNAEGLMTFGSHTHTHPILSQCTPERQQYELLTSRQFMLEHLGRGDLFAYPNGTTADFTPETKRLSSEVGYECAVSTIRGVNTQETDRYELRRVGVGADMSFSEFQIGMLGW